ncbi:hypothetical protein M0Q97_13210, partial [Candidatus Dojkabacteria bacterium]|nr:hypothetical protein [Candidatus Dojkabacteria bacterium]
INKLHLIKLAGDIKSFDNDNTLSTAFGRKNSKNITYKDLCLMDSRAIQYDPDDFLYCKDFGHPINRMITLRRFPYPCTDNLWDKETQGEPDIARLVTFYNQEINKLEELLGFSYKMKWKELTSEMEQASMQGEQSGMSGFMKSAFMAFDPNLAGNVLMGENARMYDPKHDQNKVYGPVDSIINTHIRDVGLEFNKDFDITFQYNLRSLNGRTPEYVMKDIIANVLATTYNNAKFWPGSRYWVGERPSKFYMRYQYMNTDDMDNILFQGIKDLKSAISQFGTASSAIATLSAAIKGGFQIAMGKLLDKVGRPGIPMMNSLLSGEPTGFWHLTVGNPLNPILCVGNLIIDDVEFSFPGDSLSYGDFPTKLQVKIKLKPGQAKDRAGIEMMFNHGKQRIYYAPKTIEVDPNKTIGKTTRGFFNFESKEIDNMLTQTYDFIADGVKSITKTSVQNDEPVNTNGEQTIPDNTNSSIMDNFRDKFFNI